jgi:hypothetical protein
MGRNELPDLLPFVWTRLPMALPSGRSASTTRREFLPHRSGDQRRPPPPSKPGDAIPGFSSVSCISPGAPPVSVSGAGAKLGDEPAWTSGPWQMEAVGSHSSATAIGAAPIATAAPATANSAANPNCFTCIADLLVPATVRVNVPPFAKVTRRLQLRPPSLVNGPSGSNTAMSTSARRRASCGPSLSATTGSSPTTTRSTAAKTNTSSTPPACDRRRCGEKRCAYCNPWLAYALAYVHATTKATRSQIFRIPLPLQSIDELVNRLALAPLAPDTTKDPRASDGRGCCRRCGYRILAPSPGAFC